MKLAILCPTLADGAVGHNGRVGSKQLRERMADALTEQIEKLPPGDTAMILFDEDDGKKTTGYKRNALMEAAVMVGADYIAFFDDDDLPGDKYIERVFEGMHAGADVCELWGQIYWSGIPGKPFHHSIEIDHWWEDEKYYYRNPNHLNAVKLSLVKDIPFPDQSFGEDGKWSEAVFAAGVLKTEHKIPEIIYHYFCGNPKHKL